MFRRCRLAGVPRAGFVRDRFMVGVVLHRRVFVVCLSPLVLLSLEYFSTARRRPLVRRPIRLFLIRPKLLLLRMPSRRSRPLSQLGRLAAAVVFAGRLPLLALVPVLRLAPLLCFLLRLRLLYRVRLRLLFHRRPLRRRRRRCSSSGCSMRFLLRTLLLKLSGRSFSKPTGPSTAGRRWRFRRTFRIDWLSDFVSAPFPLFADFSFFLGWCSRVESCQRFFCRSSCRRCCRVVSGAFRPVRC